MCEIFPELQNCCGCCTVRIGMLYICVLSVSSGSIMLIGVEKQLGGDFNNLRNVTNIQETLAKEKDVMKFADTATRKLPIVIPGILSIMSAFFISGGLLLMFATLSDQEGFIQAFVWLVFANIFFGLLLTLIVSVLCMFSTANCVFRGIDWLTSSTYLLGFILFLFMWFYFISVANSHMLQVYSR